MFPPTKPQTRETNSNERRIVLLGKSGAGKSATANTILGKKRFTSELCTSSVTAESEMEQVVVAGKNMTIVDTPGLFDTSMSAEDLAIEIGKSIYLSSPGPHAFLYVLQINLRFTEQEEQVVQKFEMMFGQEMRKYTIVLFTHGDQLEVKSPEELIKINSTLNKLVDQCGGGFHVFNNKDQSNRDQVIQLMEKIDRMVEKNGGNCYCNQMFKDAARFRQEEEDMKINEEQKKKETEKEGIPIEKKDSLEQFDRQRQQEIWRREEKRKHRENEGQKEKERVMKEREVKSRKDMFEESVMQSQKEGENQWWKDEIINQSGEKQKTLKCENKRGRSIGQKWMEMEKLRKEFNRKQEIERKKKQQEERQAEIERLKKEVQEDTRQESEKLPEQKKDTKFDKKRLKTEDKTVQEKDLGRGFQAFLQKHDQHLAAAGQIGAGSLFAFGVSAGFAVAAGIGAGIGVIFGPAGIAIGAAVGGVIGGVGGAVCSAIKAKKH